jgi:CHAT domain-containing protein
MTHGHRRAVVVPLGTLGLLPLHATMPEGVAIGYAPSARALQIAVGVLARPASATSSLLAIGNPSRSADESLPMAIAEVRTIAASPGRWTTASVLVAEEADRESVRRVAVGATHLHFACHGQFKPHEPLDSALFLTGDDAITLGDLLGGNVRFPDARLAVLCACHTANVDPNALPDEVLGLPMGMLIAGVPGVVGTAWPVDDGAGALFAQRFYEELARLHDPLTAVASAQRWLRDAAAPELAACIARMRAALREDDVEAGAELSHHWRWLASLPPEKRPYSAPESWAAFAYLGP